MKKIIFFTLLISALFVGSLFSQTFTTPEGYKVTISKSVSDSIVTDTIITPDPERWRGFAISAGIEFVDGHLTDNLKNSVLLNFSPIVYLGNKTYLLPTASLFTNTGVVGIGPKVYHDFGAWKSIRFYGGGGYDLFQFATTGFETNDLKKISFDAGITTSILEDLTLGFAAEYNTTGVFSNDNPDGISSSDWLIQGGVIWNPFKHSGPSTTTTVVTYRK